MKERPILFSASMVRAILDGSKTQTRRIVRMKQSEWCKEIKGDCWHPNDIAEWRLQDGRWFGLMGWYTLAFADCPYGTISDQLWVREAWRTYSSLDSIPPRNIETGAGIQYEAKGTNLTGDKGDYLCGMGKYRPSMFMPRWASRIQLEITSVRVERLQDVREADAQAEGWNRRNEVSADPQVHKEAARDWYMDLWEAINGAGSWMADPWVWVIEFRRIER